MYLARNGVMVGHYADHDFTAHARHSWTPRSGFVQPAFRVGYHRSFAFISHWTSIYSIKILS